MNLFKIAGSGHLGGKEIKPLGGPLIQFTSSIQMQIYICISIAFLVFSCSSPNTLQKGAALLFPIYQ